MIGGATKGQIIATIWGLLESGKELGVCLQWKTFKKLLSRVINIESKRLVESYYMFQLRDNSFQTRVVVMK